MANIQESLQNIQDILARVNAELENVQAEQDQVDTDNTTVEGESKDAPVVIGSNNGILNVNKVSNGNKAASGSGFRK